MNKPLIRFARRLSSWESEIGDDDLLQTEFWDRNRGRPDLRPSVYELEPAEVVRAFAEHATAFNPPGKHRWRRPRWYRPFDRSHTGGDGILIHHEGPPRTGSRGQGRLARARSPRAGLPGREDPPSLASSRCANTHGRDCWPGMRSGSGPRPRPTLRVGWRRSSPDESTRDRAGDGQLRVAHLSPRRPGFNGSHQSPTALSRSVSKPASHRNDRASRCGALVFDHSPGRSGRQFSCSLQRGDKQCGIRRGNTSPGL